MGLAEWRSSWAGLMHWVIDPKLKAISENYEKKQKHYLARTAENGIS